MEHAIAWDPEFSIPLRVPPSDLAIVKGFHGKNRWQGLSCDDRTFAVELSAPFGSVVVAARSGIVAALTMDHNVCSRRADMEPWKARFYANRTNFIVLDHDGGDHQTLYAHLEQGSQCVQFGQRVEEGKMIARTGRSGLLGETSHVLFQVQRWVEYAIYGIHRQMSLPFRFKGYAGSLEHTDLMPR